MAGVFGTAILWPKSAAPDPAANGALTDEA
jgi:hypothetical protein